MIKKLVRLIYRIYFKTESQVNEYDFIDKHLKKKGYQEYGDVYSKGFIVIKLNLKAKEIISIDIWVDNISKTKQEIKEHFSTGILIAEKYFSRL